MLDKIIFFTLTSFTLGSLGQLFRNFGLNVYLFDIFIAGANLYLLLFFLKKKKFYLNSPLILFSFFSLFLFFVNLFATSDLLLSEKLISLAFWIRLNFYFIFGYFVLNLLKYDYLPFEDLKKILIWNFYFLLILNFLQYFFLRDISFMENYGFDPHTSRLVGFFLDPNFMGFYLVVYLFLNEFYLKKEFISYSSLVMIFLTESRSTFLVLLIFITYLFLTKIKKAFIFLLLSTILFGLSSLPVRFEASSSSNDSLSLRFISYEYALQIYNYSPYFGIGIGNYSSYLKATNLLGPQNFNSNSNNYSDSSLLSVFVFSGFLGLVIFLIFIVCYFKNQRNIFFLIAILFNSLAINSLFFPPLMVIIFLILNLNYEID